MVFQDAQSQKLDRKKDGLTKAQQMACLAAVGQPIPIGKAVLQRNASPFIHLWIGRGFAGRFGHGMRPDVKDAIDEE